MEIKVPMTDAQREWIDDTTRELMIEGSAGSGKGLSLDELIPTPTGWVSMRDLQVGDDLFDEQGNICQVTYKSPIHNIECYELTFENGYTVIVDKEHRWKCQTGNYTQNRIWSTEEMFDYLEKQDRKNPRGFIIDAAKPLQLPEQDLLISSYVLGAWLGDGAKHHGSITNHPKDHQIIEEIHNEGWETSKHYSDEICYTILGLKPYLRELNVLENKHIPNQYLRASFEQRLSLLQGIMDTDGSIDEKGTCEITWADYNMTLQLRELLFTLGIKTAEIHSKFIQLEGWDSPREYYRLHFTTDLPIFRLQRKLDRIPKTVRKTQKRRYVKQIKKVGSVPTQCITVDSDSHLFLATKEFVPTHNTIFACYKTIFYALQFSRASIYVYRKTLPSLKRTAWKEIRQILQTIKIGEHEDGTNKYMYDLCDENKSEGKITFPNDSVIYFGALDESSKVRSINADLIYIEQCEEILDTEFYYELMLRLGRGEASKRPEGYSQMLLVVQPEDEEHWLYKRFHEYYDATKEYENGVKEAELHNKYYPDNPWTPKTYEEILESIKARRKTAHFHYSQNDYLPTFQKEYYDNLKNEDYELWLRYSAGKWGKLTDIVYPNYDTVIDRDQFDCYSFGADFGYNNPSAFLLLGWYDNEVYVLDEVYETKLTNQELIDECKEMLFKNKLLPEHLSTGYGDKAEPDRIKEFNQAGIPMIGGIKDVNAKITTTKQTRIHIHPQCVNTIKEIKGYKYRKNHDGITLDEPIKTNDHAMDALGYGVYGYRGALSPSRPHPPSYYEDNIMIF